MYVYVYVMRSTVNFTGVNCIRRVLGSPYDHSVGVVFTLSTQYDLVSPFPGGGKRTTTTIDLTEGTDGPPSTTTLKKICLETP